MWWILILIFFMVICAWSARKTSKNKFDSHSRYMQNYHGKRYSDREFEYIDYKDV